MKQGINFILPIKIGLNIDEVESIEFCFKQQDTRLYFTYPSDTCYRKEEGSNILCCKWSISDTFVFTTKMPVEVDSFIVLKDSKENPPTEIVEFRFSPTLFIREELLNNYE